MQRIEITHSTRYRYPTAVRFEEHTLHLRPREGHDIRVESSELQINPAFAINWRRDVYGNSVAAVRFSESGDRLDIVSRVTVEHYEETAIVPTLTDAARSYPFAYHEMERIDLVPYQTPVFPQDRQPLLDWLGAAQPQHGPVETLAFLEGLNRRIADQVDYLVRNEPGVQPPATTLQHGTGSCRDSATLFIEACRHYNLASRFVSGYLVSNAAVQDQATTHAWAEVYLPGAGWRGLDTTSGQWVGGDHIAAAVHRHPEAIPPVAGSFIGPAEPAPKMTVEVKVERLQ